jgi:hypothetical protein
MGSDKCHESEDRVTLDSVYSRMSEVALRHRNYETETARWYTPILVAILGFILSSKFGEGGSGAMRLLSGSLPAQVGFAAIVCSIAFLSCYSIQFYHLQHTRVEKYIDSLLEPEEVQKRMEIMKMPRLKPRFLLMGTQILLAGVTVAVIFLRP